MFSGVSSGVQLLLHDGAGNGLLVLDAHWPPQDTSPHVEQHDCQHQSRSDPDTPVTMGVSPVWMMDMIRILQPGVIFH